MLHKLMTYDGVHLDSAGRACVIVSASTPQGWMTPDEFCSSCMRMAPAWYASSAQMPDPPRRYDRSLMAGTAYCTPGSLWSEWLTRSSCLILQSTGFHRYTRTCKTK